MQISKNYLTMSSNINNYSTQYVELDFLRLCILISWLLMKIHNILRPRSNVDIMLSINLVKILGEKGKEESCSLVSYSCALIVTKATIPINPLRCNHLLKRDIKCKYNKNILE